jgi:hypothetical protein
LTGSGITASIALEILGDYQTITIVSPLNQTYNFGIGDNYTLDLNVSANFNPSSWSYSLWDLKHNIKVNDSIAFSPNTTFNAVRWSNELIVYAINSSGGTVSASVTFFIDVPNSAPFFGAINSSMTVCENNALSYDFNVTDIDEQVLQLSLTPTDPFYLDTIFTSDSVKTSFIELFSGTISDTDAVNGSISKALKIYSVGWMTYPEIIEVTDQEYSDTDYTNITAIRVNDAPVISTIGVQTVWSSGEGSTFYKQVQVTDEEDGDQDSGELNFTIEFLDSDPLFNINGSGVMNFTANSSHVGVYNIRVCVNDTGIYNVHPSISELCGQDGSSITTCQNFSLTVTDENRAPTITSYYPVNLTLSVSGTGSLYFNISEYDPDGTIPDAYWYVDGVFADYDSGSLVDEFVYTFGCDVSGTKTVKAEITDGLLNDSVEWTIDVDLVACPVPGVPGGGGRAARPACREKWVCSIWGVCQNTERSLDVGLLSGEDYRIINEQCAANNWGSEFCGVQIRACFDANSCNVTYYKPLEVQSCYYTEEPSCDDGIKNCHDDACELLIDCGGPCLPCPSCSDKIQNQGEEEIDCGGPCPWKCEVELPFIKRFNIWFLLLILIILIILIIILIRKLRKIHRYKKRLKMGA